MDIPFWKKDREPPVLRRILFVCTGNTCRSALAEQFLRKKFSDAGRADVEVKSAGVAAYPDMESPPEVLRILEPLGIDGSLHRAQSLSRELVDWADLILAMEGRHQMAVAQMYPRSVGKVHVFKSYVGADGEKDIPDPIGRPQDVYDACAADIQAALEKLVVKCQ